MKNKQSSKTLIGKTGKDLLTLVESKSKHSGNVDFAAPSGDTEIALFNFWNSLLGNKNFGVNEDFFQIGGNSLKAIQLLSRIYSEFSVQLEPADVFLKPTISQLAALIDSRNKTTALPSVLKTHKDSDKVPLSFSQERLWFTDHVDGSLPYHVSAVLRLKGNLNISALENSIQTVVNRHEILRTVILEEEGHAYQIVKEKNKWRLTVADDPLLKENNESLQSYIQQLINKPFDLSNDDMLRAAIISLDINEHILVLTMHHISSDALSLSILVGEVTKFYEKYEKGLKVEITEPELQYSDYAIWQRKNLTGETFDKKLNYWKEKLNNTEPLQLPSDFNRPAVRSTKGAITYFSIDKKLTDGLEHLSRENGSTLFMTLQTTFKILLYRYSRQEDICVGTSIANRTKQEVEGLIGFFVNTLALRNEVKGDISFTELLRQVKAPTLEAFENQEIPFDKVVDSVVKERDPGISPLFQVMLVMQFLPDISKFRLGKVKMFKEKFDQHSSKFDFTFFITETAKGLSGSVEYSTDLYKEETINRMVLHFTELLGSIIKDPDQPVGQINMLSKSEEKKFLAELNKVRVRYPEKSVVDLFEKQVLKTP
ncbi:MAG TPA: condensation domain-containing protein, partial [Ignavibacteria bacterium]|nr:condensation domain-containing protein [Ignavibacteria bacterium]